jgi:hypothetical protein
MHIKIMKSLAAAMLLWGGLGLFNPSYQTLLGIVVCIAALFVFGQALDANKFIWAVGFLAIALIYNPVVPIRFSGRISLWLDWMGLMTFLISLVALKRRPKLTLVSVTNQSPRSESL